MTNGGTAFAREKLCTSNMVTEPQFALPIAIET
jgi:hypothetical protein